MSAETGAGTKSTLRRGDGRSAARLRPVTIRRGVLRLAEGSAWIRIGNTQLLCAVTVDEKLPPWMRAKGAGGGWITAEYGMLPRSVPERSQRGKTSGRAYEIQRLIGRCLRAAVDRKALGDRTITVDCGVLEADGGTRVAAITGGWVALQDCFTRLRAEGRLAADPMKCQIAAVSVGLVGGEGLLDLCHEEDSRAQVDLNIVGTSDGRLVEIQGAAEGDPFEEREIARLIKIARRGLKGMFRAQDRALASGAATGRLFEEGP